MNDKRAYSGAGDPVVRTAAAEAARRVATEVPAWPSSTRWTTTLLLTATLVIGTLVIGTPAAMAQTTTDGALPIRARNVAVSRAGANKTPRSEADQALAGGWPLYRTERGQQAFNDTMATLAATDGTPPAAAAFGGCRQLGCPLSLPRPSADGWLPAGRLWISPTAYVLIVKSPRQRNTRTWRRRPDRAMRVFVFHEFHNSSRNIDPYDTISSHRSAVFVPFYMSKVATDAHGRRFVVVVQVAPYDVVSVHATNHGSAGPGIEVARNATDAVEPLQSTAGILVATMVTTAAPRLEVVNHRGSEGLAMLEAYKARLTTVRAKPSSRTIALPFTPAAESRLASVATPLDRLVTRGGASPPIAVADRGFLPRRATPQTEPPEPGSAAAPRSTAIPAAERHPIPQLVGPVLLVRRSGPPPDTGTPRLIGPIRPAVRPPRTAGAG